MNHKFKHGLKYANSGERLKGVAEPKRRPYKERTKTTEQQNQTSNSIAGSMLQNVAGELGLEGLFEGKIKHAYFDCPINLREAFKQEAKLNGSSVCKELQKFQLSYIVASRIKKHALGNIMSKIVDLPVTIQSLNLNQYVQSSVRRYGKVSEEKDSDRRHYCSAR